MTNEARTRTRHESLRRRYTSLGMGELVAAAVFAVVAASGMLPVTGTREGALALWSTLVPLLVILVQVGAYWLLARGWAGRTRMPRRVARVYRGFRILDAVLLAAGLIGVIVWFPAGAGAVLVVAAWLFGVVEYLNYFVVRLSYPLHRWPFFVTQWRTPRLVKDLRTAG